MEQLQIPLIANKVLWLSLCLISNMGLEAFDLVNGYRGREGIAPVILNTTVASVSRSHSQDRVIL